MKNRAIKKIISVTLTVLMLVGLIVPGTVLNVLAAPSSYPAPITTATPTYLKEFAKPTASISVGDYDTYVYPSVVSGAAVSGAPVIATITEQAGPYDSVSIYGTNLEGAKVYAYGLVNGVGAIKELVQTSNKDGFINAIIDKKFDYTMYTVWVQGADGKVSAPVRVNAPKLTWISATKASSNVEVRIYGKFLTKNNADGDDAETNVYLTNGSNYYKATVVEADPYRVTIKLPEGLTNNTTYKVWVHNGHGGNYGWSNSLDITYNSTADDFWKTGASYQKTANPSNFRSVITSAPAGTTVTLENGTYVVDQQIKLYRSIRIVGQSKDGVKIVAKFTQNGGSDSLRYGDLNVNSSWQSAFYVAATPCEFSNLTFMDYVNNSTLYTGVTAPANYDLNYAHGIFIYGGNATDTGAASQLKIDNCDFKIQRTHSDTNCIYIKDTTTREQLHTQFKNKYGTDVYCESTYGSAPLWIDTDRVEISNCTFETPKEIITRGSYNSYIHDNTFIGTWVISGNSGPAAFHDNNTLNLDFSNNRIYGKDETIDPNGYVQTGDLTYARTIVFQKAQGSAGNEYVANNHASRVGELDYNSGEHILFEEETITYAGTATFSNNKNTLHLKNISSTNWFLDTDGYYKFKAYITADDGTLKAGHARKLLGQTVAISKGTGAGQWRTIASADAGGVLTIDRDWDVQPDENSVFIVAPGYINPIVYNNTIEGPKMYYKNFNSTLGVNAYATMVGTVIDRNNFSQMQAGVAINPHYNIKTYTVADTGETVRANFGFVFFADLLVMNNTISNTRYGIWNFPSITMNSDDYSSAEADLDLQLCSIIRGNTISDSNRLKGTSTTNLSVKNATKKRGGASIVVGRDFWNRTEEPNPPMLISTRYWMNNIVVENNTLSDVENNSGDGFIDVAFSQDNTILRNNTTDGEFRETYEEIEVERNPSSYPTGYEPQDPVYVLPTPEIVGPGGTEEDGMKLTGSEEPNARIANNDFLEGFTYWSSVDGTAYASSMASVANSVATITKGKNNGLKSAPFKMPAGDISAVASENKVAFVVSYTSNNATVNAQLYVNGVSQGNAKAFTYSSGKLKIFYYENVYWNINDTYHVAIVSSSGTTVTSIDYIDVARCETKDAVLDLVNGRVYSSKGDITDNVTHDTINNSFTNVEFVSGVDQWGKASHFGAVSASNGVATLSSVKFQSDYFPVDFENGDKIGLIYNFTSISDVTVTLLRKDVAADSTVTDSTVIEPTVIAGTDLAMLSLVNYTSANNATTYFSIVVEGTANLDYISVVVESGSGVNLVYTDIISGKRFLSDLRDPDGTEEAGFEKLGKKYSDNETYAINDTLMNGDFSEGLKYWTAAKNTGTVSSNFTGDRKANAADSAKSVENGVVTVTPSGGSGRGISSAHFKVPNAENYEKFVITFEYNHTPGDVTGLVAGTDYTATHKDWFKAEVLVGADHTTVLEDYVGDTKGEWKTHGLWVTINDPDDFYMISFEGFNIKTEFKLRNVKLMFVDKGGISGTPLVNLDGTLTDESDYGDANYDGNVDILDLVRTKKELAKNNSNGIFFAAADTTKDGNLDANDLIKIVAMITGKK